MRKAFFFEEPQTHEDLQRLWRILDRTKSDALQQAVCNAFQRIACPHNCFVIEEQTYCLVTVTTRPFLIKMGTPHSCEQAEANSAGYRRLNALTLAWQNAVRTLGEPQSEESKKGGKAEQL